jgi:hypothetical protein
MPCRSRGLVDDVGAAVLVAGDRQRQTESEQQPDNAEQCGLQDPERLLEVIRKVAGAPCAGHCIGIVLVPRGTLLIVAGWQLHRLDRDQSSGPGATQAAT